MSYSQLLRRLNRILKARASDVFDGLTGNARDLHDFDEELKKTGARDTEGAAGPRADAGGAQSGQRSQSRSEQGRGQGAAAGQGTRKPGEKDDAHYYAVLGLTPDASVERIRAAYRKLMSEVHPDRVATLGPDEQKAALTRAQAVNEAYHIIERRRGFK